MTRTCDRCGKEVNTPIIVDAKKTKSDMPTYYIIAVTEDDHPVIHFCRQIYNCGILCGDCQLKLRNWLQMEDGK